MKHFIGLLFITSILSCVEADSQNITNAETSDLFNNYWYAGDAELTRYQLKQSRYGEIHEGDAVLIFVSEEFRSDKQVKYEGGNRKNVIPILKLNHTKKFNTGIYPYSLMTSVFTPMDLSSTLKVTTSAQEWCGHSFAQLNKKGKGYKVNSFSYFQNEGDRSFTIDNALLEDEIWTKIRIAPEHLPKGNITVIPGTQYTTLKHKEIAPISAVASMSKFTNPSFSDQDMKKYRIEYQGQDRVLEIYFESDFPYKIVGWTEEGIGGYKNPQKMKTVARRTNTLKSPYWSKNNKSDSGLRKELGLE